MSDYDSEDYGTRSSVAESVASEKRPAPLVKQQSKLQKNFGQYLTNLLPILLNFGKFVDDSVDKITPLVFQAMDKYQELYAKLEPYNPEAILGMLTGVAMMFFGGFFISTVAVVEAFLQAGSDRLLKNLKILRDQVRLVKEANDRDDKLDEDNDGIADVNQISAEQLTYRKILVVVKACNPDAVNEAMSALYTVLIAVVATLRVRFARTVSLGGSLGEQIAKPVLKFAQPVLTDVLPKEFQKWVEPTLKYLCRALGVSIAFALERVLATVHTAIRGSYILTAAFTKFAESRNLNYLSDGYADDLFSFAMAGLGIYAQLFIWRSLPAIIKVLFFPAFGVEWLLSTFISFTV